MPEPREFEDSGPDGIDESYFELGVVIGVGAVGKVIIATSKKTQKKYALKVMQKKAFITTKMIKQL